MLKSLLLYIALLFIGSAVSQICPPSNFLQPCSCSEETKTISCEWIETPWDIKETFDRASRYINETTVFDVLKIHDTSINTIPADSIISLKFLKVSIRGNTNLESISPTAFGATLEYTTELNLYSNRINTEGSNERTIYELINKFIKATFVDLTLNELSSVPANAFGLLPNLKDIFLSYNRITNIKSHAFSGLSNAGRIRVSSNKLRSIGISIDAFEGVSSSATVYLHGNPIRELEEGMFRPLLDRANMTTVGGSSCGPTGCKVELVSCDRLIVGWICENVEFYKGRLSGAMCTDDQDVFEYCVSL